MNNSKLQQQMYRSKKWLTKDFVTEECDKLVTEDFDESISQVIQSDSSPASNSLSPGGKINAVKVFQSFDNILTYDKGQVSSAFRYF